MTMFQDLCWLGSDHVIAATCCGTFFSLPRDATESPVPLSISVLVSSDLHATPSHMSFCYISSNHAT